MSITIPIIVVAAAMVFLIAIVPSVTSNRGGRILAFMSLFIFPSLALFVGLVDHVERSKRTEFCLSCHTMTDYGKSLMIDDPTHLPAAHYQQGRVPHETACFTCHTTYTMYGDYKAKLEGLRHVYVQYLGKVPSPIKLYQPYNNRECLHCHEGTRAFIEASPHKDDMKKIEANQMSCIAKGCHDQIHDIAGLAKAQMWTPPTHEVK